MVGGCVNRFRVSAVSYFLFLAWPLQSVQSRDACHRGLKSVLSTCPRPELFRIMFLMAVSTVCRPSIASLSARITFMLILRLSAASFNLSSVTIVVFRVELTSLTVLVARNRPPSSSYASECPRRIVSTLLDLPVTVSDAFIVPF
jgi:hypothetical protein